MTHPMHNPQAEMTEVLVAIEDSAEKFLKDRGGLNVPRQHRVFEPQELPKQEFGRDDWQQIVALGWPAMLVPEALGGLGLGLDAASAVARKVGRWLAPEPFTAVAGVVVTLLAGASPAAARELLEWVLSGERIVGVALDLDERLSASSMACRIEVGGEGERRLYGVAPYVVPVDPADGWLIVALDEQGGPILLYVAADNAGLRVEPQIEADGRCRARLCFDGVRLSRPAIVAQGPEVAELLGRAASIGRLLYGAELLGAAEQMHELTRDYISQRHQFGKPIGSFQVLQHRCVDVLIQIELARASLRQAVASATDQALNIASLQANLCAGHAAMEAGQAAVHLHGAMGMTDECDVGLYFKRVLALLPRFGSEQTLKLRWFELTRNDNPGDQVVCDWSGEFPRRGDWDCWSDGEFRRMLRAFLIRHYPTPLRHMPRRVHWHEIGDWYRCLSQQGWIAPAWPETHGGMGLPAAKLIAWHEEFEAYGVARAPDQGILMVGPVLMRFGSAEQQQRFLPKILSGENIWCQGYSEPNAGSDLASLRAEALLEGEHFIVSGQKTWTTLAQDATHIFLLVRTDKAAKPQAGISFLLCDLNSPGISVRPIRDLAGHCEFCEVFFDNVRVPHENLVGQVNQGWTIAKALLGFERLHLGSPKQSQHALGHLKALGQQLDLMGDSAFRTRYAELALDVANLTALYTQYADYVKRGEPLPPSVSILKIWATETYQRIGLAIVRSAGSLGALAGATATGDGQQHLLAALYNGSAAKIYGGSNEVQRNILARTVLELPS